MSKINLNNVGSLIDATTAQTTINSNSSTIQTAFDNTLSRDGTTPNQMAAPLDMNSQQIVNLPAPLSDSSPLRLQDLSDFTGGGTVSNIPAGGSTHDILNKTSNADYAIGWTTVASEITAGNNIAKSGSSPVTISTVNSPNFTTSVTTPSLVLNGSTLSGFGTGIPAFLATPTSANLASALTDETGTGKAVFGTSPSLITPLIQDFTDNTKQFQFGLTGIATGSTRTWFIQDINDTFVGRATTDTLTNKTLVAPALGTPVSGVATNLTGTAAGLTAGTVTTNANLTGPITSVGNATAITSQTGTGTKFVVDTSPALTGTPTAPTAAAGTNTTQIATTAGIVAERSATKTLTNTTYDTAGTGNSFSINGVAATANTGTGSVVRGTSPTITTPNIVGTATNNDASAGSVGEYVSATGALASVTANVAATLTSISLTAGDWDVSWLAQSAANNATTNVVSITASISTTAATHSFTLGDYANVWYGAAGTVPGNGNSLIVPGLTKRFSLSTTTTIYVVGTTNFSVSTNQMGGFIRARRVR